MADEKPVKRGSSQVWGWVRFGGYIVVKFVFWILEVGG